VDWKVLGAVVTIFVGGLLSLAWVDSRYARADTVAADKVSMQDDIREIKADIKEILRKVK
jgi:hypothetical protein